MFSKRDFAVGKLYFSTISREGPHRSCVSFEIGSFSCENGLVSATRRRLRCLWSERSTYAGQRRLYGAFLCFATREGLFRSDCFCVRPFYTFSVVAVAAE